MLKVLTALDDDLEVFLIGRTWALSPRGLVR